MSDDEIAAMSVKELRAHITSAGLSFADCIEKSDLRARAKEATSKAASSGASGPSAPGSAPPSWAGMERGGGGAARPTAAAEPGAVTTVHLAGYECTVNAPAGEGPIDLLCVVLHGYGASNSDFAPFPELFARLPSSELAGKRVGWVFPQAGPDAQGTPAWWRTITCSNPPPPDLHGTRLPR
jgi:hypothetical protein